MKRVWPPNPEEDTQNYTLVGEMTEVQTETIREKKGDLHKGGFTSKFYSNPTLIIMQAPTHKHEGVNSSTHNTQQPFDFLTELQSVDPLPTSLE